MTVTVEQLLNRGEMSIERGRLVIRSFSGKPVPQDWLTKHSSAFVGEILAALAIEAYEYGEYSTGLYGRTKAAGVTLQLQPFEGGTHAYAIFNADLTRDRTTKAGVKGSSLPKGHFRIGKGSHLYRLWQSTGLPFPKRLSALHDYLGNLRGILFTAEHVPGRNNRLNAGTLRPLNIGPDQVRKAFLSNTLRTTAGQLADNWRTNTPDKESARGQERQGPQGILTACGVRHGTTVISTCGNTELEVPRYLRTALEEQSAEDWLACYCSPARDLN